MVKGKITISALLLIIFSLFMSFSAGGYVRAETDERAYSNVTEDLQKDETFNISEYPDDAGNYSICVIQIAESTSGELLIYTYQPCQQTTSLTATFISMSLSNKMGGEVNNGNLPGNNQGSDTSDDNNNPDTEVGDGHGGGGFGGRSISDDADKPKLYGLSLLNASGVFCKYLVNDFKVSSDNVRYYNIASVYRDFINDIDAPAGTGYTKNGVAFNIGKLYKAETVDGTVKYYCKNVDTVEIKTPFVDFLSYYNGMTWGSAFGLEGDSYTDVHYIAFSTDKQIDTLEEADVTYTTQSYQVAAFGGGTTYGEKSAPQYKTLTGEMSGSTPGGFLAGKYTWKCIQTSEEFIKNTNLNSATAETVKKSAFVLVFLTTPYEQKEVYNFMQGHSYEVNGTKVADVAILRLQFVTNGTTYNLGAVSDIVTGDDIPGNKPDDDNIGFWAYIWRCIVRLFNGTATLTEKIVAIVTLLIASLFLPLVLTVLSLIFPAFRKVMKTILNGIWTGIKWLAKSAWWFICLPFRGIAALIKKIKSRPKKPKAKPKGRRKRK